MKKEYSRERNHDPEGTECLVCKGHVRGPIWWSRLARSISVEVSMGEVMGSGPLGALTHRGLPGAGNAFIWLVDAL